MAAAKKPASESASTENAMHAAFAPLNGLTEQFRETAEKGMEQVRANYATVKDAAEKASGKIGESVTAAKSGALNINLKAIEHARSNINASFDHATALFGAKSVEEFVNLQTEFAKTQVAALTDQAKELAALSQKAVQETAEPVKSTFSK